MAVFLIEIRRSGNHNECGHYEAPSLVHAEAMAEAMLNEGDTISTVEEAPGVLLNLPIVE